ncbi:MAG: FAD-binding protein [Chromatiales bacterium]|nr:FAD-binding protein [Chromatiales bacterium]
MGSKSISYEQALADYRVEAERPLIEQHDNKEALLSAYHPDYRADTMTTLKVGPNSGDQCHRQVAASIQADARIDEADLAGASVVETDVLVIGGGGAGCAAALVAAVAGARVILATKLRLGDSNTVMAEGGIQASIDKNDTPQMHYDDTLAAGHGYGDRSLVAQMVMDGPDVIRWLIQQGMQFDTDEFGDLLTRRAGGTSANRVCYYRDYTGLEMMRSLREAVRNSDAEVWEYSPVVELMVNEQGHCAGAVISNLKDCSYVQVIAKSVILATGGIGRMHLNDFPTSNHFGATGDGLVLAYRLGAKLRDLDSFQYHPTGLAHPHHLAGTLITEGVRSAGTWLLNGNGERFVDELKPRDVVAAAILKECAEGRGIHTNDGAQGVWLDTPGLELRNPGILKQRFPKLLNLGKKAGIDPHTSPLLIYPTLHYQNGGVAINENGETTVPGLYCVGEASGGIHGKNRIMGNALLEIISFGRRAGAHAAERRSLRGHKRVSIDHLSRLRRELTISNMPMETKGPMLFPVCAKFDDDVDYEGLRRNRRK